MRSNLLLSVTAVATLTTLTWAQHQVYQIAGRSNGSLYGRAVAGVGDINRDGYADALVGAPGGTRWNAKTRAGYAELISGRDGRVLRRFDAGRDRNVFDRFGRAVAAAGDVDRDGHTDLVIGAPGRSWQVWIRPIAYVFSGKTGQILHRFESRWPGFGQSVSSAGDVNRDGFDDVIVGAPPQTCGTTPDPGHVVVFSGKTGEPLHTFTGPPHVVFGLEVAPAGDVNSDHHPDIAVSGSNHFSGPGFVRIYSGKTGAVLRTYTGQLSGDSFGESLAPAGDVDGDRVMDLIVGAPQRLAMDRGYARVYSGKTGRVLHTLRGARLLGAFGASVGSVGDLNRDGKSDVLVVAASDGSGRVTFYSGADGKPLHSLARTGRDPFVSAAAQIGDINGDGTPELVLGAALASGGGSHRGMARIASARPLSLCTDRSSISITHGGAQDLLLEKGKTHAGKAYLLLGSMSGIRSQLRIGNVPVPLNPKDAWFRITLAHPGAVLAGSFGVLDANGRASATFRLPRATPRALADTVFHHAWLVLDPQSLTVESASNAASLLIVE